MDYTVPAPCPHCGVEIRMAMEETDDGHPDSPSFFWVAVDIADEQELDDPHTCALTPEEVEAMCEVASRRAQTDPYYRDARYEDFY